MYPDNVMMEASIIIVEDDEKLRRNIEFLISSAGHRVERSFDQIHYDEITSMLQYIDIILLDINLPGELNGVEFAEKIREQYDTAIIYITGNVSEAVFANVSRTNMYGFLPKPFTKEQLFYAINVSLVRKQYERSLADRLENIKNKEKLIQLGEFAGSFVHDLNTFNTIVMGSFRKIQKVANTEVTEKEVDTIREFAKRGIIGSERINELSEKYRKLLDDRVVNEKMDIVLFNLIKEVSDYFEEQVSENEIEVIIECEKDLVVNSCEVVILQSIVNFVSNAIYEIKNKNPPERWIKIKASRENDFTFVSVVDSGPGIKLEDVSKVFDAGFSTKILSDTEGTGVGLSFVKEQVENVLNGTMTLDKEDGYTRFKIGIPKD